MCPAAAEARKEILSGEFAHDGDPILAAHIKAGRAVDVGPDQFKVVRQDGRRPPPIDACIAFIGANALTKFSHPDPWAMVI
jgi:hypothetical protein